MKAIMESTKVSLRRFQCEGNTKLSRFTKTSERVLSAESGNCFARSPMKVMIKVTERKKLFCRKNGVVEGFFDFDPVVGFKMITNNSNRSTLKHFFVKYISESKVMNDPKK